MDVASTKRRDQTQVATWQQSLALAGARLRTDVVFAMVDAAIVVIAYSAALLLRFIDFQGVTPDWWKGFVLVLPVVIIVHVVANLIFGAYGHVWEFASVEEAMRVVAATATASITLFVGMMTYREISGEVGPVPVMVLAVGALLTLGGMGAARFRSRLFSFRRLSGVSQPAITLVVGTDQGAVDLARRGLQADHPVAVVGFLAIDPTARSRKLAGLPVMGSVRDLRAVLLGTDFDQVVVAGSVGEQIVRQVVDDCMDVDVRLRTLPDIDEVLNSNGNLRHIRDLEITDLLPRPTVSTDLARVKDLVSGRVVMVTGAGGSIGAEIVEQVLRFDAAEVLCLDHDETHLYEAMQQWASPKAQSILCDIRDRNRLLRIFAQHRPQVVFHAAAHKHVPILESAPEEAVKTNILGTSNLLDAVGLYGTERFVLISTDKAVAPKNVMGASKRFAEMMIQTAAANRSECVYAAVRFGNVLGTRGSVVPTFTQQILSGGPVTISDPAMTRYFMTVSEAVELVLQASAIADDGDVLVLDMGEPVKIMDLAHRMIRLAGLVPGRDIEVIITGARPGEKLNEELSLKPPTPSLHPKIWLVRPTWPGAVTLLDAVEQLGRLASDGDREGVREMLFSLTSAEWADNETVSLRLFEYSDMLNRNPAL